MIRKEEKKMGEVYDVAVIGGGPGGYVCAIKAAQLGLKVVCIEKRSSLGGTCLNVGCIPSKTLLNSSEKYEHAKHGMEEFGIELTGVKLNLSNMMLNKDKTIKSLTNGIDGLFKKNKITRVYGHASIKTKNQISVIDDKNEESVIETKNIVIATGSQVSSIPGIVIDEDRIVSSSKAISLDKVPSNMVVIGGGYIGLELGSVWRRLGAEVTVVEYAPNIVPAMDLEISKQFQKILEKQGIKFKLSTKVISAVNQDNKVSIKLEALETNIVEEITADIALMSVGRKPYTENLGLEDLKITVDKMGRISTDEHFRTNIDNIYAIGDVITGPMLAHKAEEEGVAVAEILAGQKGHVNYDVIAGIVYTYPEVATVGKTEEELKKAGVAYKVGKFPFLANSRGKAVSETDGFVKILACAEKDKILGVHIIGPQAGTIIHEAVVAMEFGASSEDLARICHAHPTLNEAVKEASLATFFKPIHM